MDKKMSKSLCLYRIERAKEDVSEASILLKEEKYRGANNIAYYAIFHAIKAILALEEKDFKKHKDCLAYFNQNYIKTEAFPKLLGRKIHIASDIREDSDYEDFYLATRKEAEEQIETAEELIKYIEKYIKEI